uniref:Uncharacterized protein n=1 Tax=Rhizophora mucronata TaxID=61149 RepID=A0A2P2Q0I5_RHIMU
MKYRENEFPSKYFPHKLDSVENDI